MTFAEMAALYCETQECEVEQLRQRLIDQINTWEPNGWMLLECQMLDSSWMGSRVVLPFGPLNTFKEIPNHPISPRGLASDMSTVIGWIDAAELKESVQ
jgi:hypothetical protein